ncbi:hypothetical protein VB712_14735 [Spirulina sp. CCNP1310]|nr:hypothetical protein [Spirulina sp. CCNP1310]MEA5420486.1 hypothetical protein [Spirulina sp. CCNP1310]
MPPAGLRQRPYGSMELPLGCAAVPPSPSGIEIPASERKPVKTVPE